MPQIRLPFNPDYKALIAAFCPPFPVDCLSSRSPDPSHRSHNDKSQQDAALLLDMGKYMYCLDGPQGMPLVLTARDLQPPVAAAATVCAGEAGGESESQRPTSGVLRKLEKRLSAPLPLLSSVSPRPAAASLRADGSPPTAGTTGKPARPLSADAASTQDLVDPPNYEIGEAEERASPGPCSGTVVYGSTPEAPEQGGPGQAAPRPNAFLRLYQVRGWNGIFRAGTYGIYFSVQD